MKEGKSKADSANSRLAVRKEEKKVAKAFCVFLEDFRKHYQEKHPDNESVAAVSHFFFHCFYSAGDKWRSINDEEKAPFIAKAEKRMEEYERKMEAYYRKLAGGCNDESDKSKSEVNDEEESGEEEDDDD